MATRGQQQHRQGQGHWQPAFPGVPLPRDVVDWEAHPATWVIVRQRLGTEANAAAPEPALQPAPIELPRLAAVDQVEWEAVVWDPGRQPPASTRRGAGVATFARRLMARERSRTRRAKPAELAKRLRPSLPASPRPGERSSLA